MLKKNQAIKFPIFSQQNANKLTNNYQSFTTSQIIL